MCVFTAFVSRLLTMRPCGSVLVCAVRFDALRYGAVRCGLQYVSLQTGPNRTAQYLLHSKLFDFKRAPQSNGAVRCGFALFILVVRFGADFIFLDPTGRFGPVL